MTRFVALSGFLGAGKTTTLAAMGRMLEQRGRRVAIVTNDQGTELVDTRVAAAAIPDVAEVTGGCFCCRFEDLEDVVTAAVEARGAEVILAEAVGSCTDLQATVVRPMRRRYGDDFIVSPLVAVVDPVRYAALGRSLALRDEQSDLAYLFDRQLADADVIAVNKIDLLARPDAGALRTAIRRRYPHAEVVEYSATTGAGLTSLVDVLAGGAGPERDLDVDYERYAAAEAELAWLNHTVRLVPVGSKALASSRWGRVALESLASTALRRGWVVGHAKVLIEPPDGLGTFTKLSLVGADEAAVLDADAGPMRQATARLNARVACHPADLDAAVTDALRSADAATGSMSRAASGPASFAPSYPTPRYRLAVQSTNH